MVKKRRITIKKIFIGKPDARPDAYLVRGGGVPIQVMSKAKAIEIANARKRLRKKFKKRFGK